MASINDKSHVPVYLERESDVDMNAVEKAIEGKTKKELENEWEEFKRSFKMKHTTT